MISQTSCPKIPPNSGAEHSSPITKLFLSHLSLLKRSNFAFIKCSGRCNLAVNAGQSRCYCRSSPLLAIGRSHAADNPKKNGSKGIIPKTTIGEILERARAAAAVADPRRSIPYRLGLPRRPLSAGEDDIFLLLGALRRPMTCDDHPIASHLSTFCSPTPQKMQNDSSRTMTTSNKLS